MELQQLLKECKGGSITAQKYLFDKYATSYFLLCRRYVKTDEQAEETMMTGFLKIFKSLVSFDYNNDAISLAWMKKIMVNECLQALRKRSAFLSAAEDEAKDIAIDEEVIDKLSAEEIFNLITQLPSGYRTVFNLYVVEGYNHKEIGKLLNITEGTSKSQLSKAKSMLQQLYIKQNQSHAKSI